MVVDVWRGAHQGHMLNVSVGGNEEGVRQRGQVKRAFHLSYFILLILYIKFYMKSSQLFYTLMQSNQTRESAASHSTFNLRVGGRK